MTHRIQHSSDVSSHLSIRPSLDSLQSRSETVANVDLQSVQRIHQAHHRRRHQVARDRTDLEQRQVAFFDGTTGTRAAFTRCFSSTYVTCPSCPTDSLGIKMQYLNLYVKNLRRYFVMEIEVPTLVFSAPMRCVQRSRAGSGQRMDAPSIQDLHLCHENEGRPVRHALAAELDRGLESSRAQPRLVHENGLRNDLCRMPANYGSVEHANGHLDRCLFSLARRFMRTVASGASSSPIA